MDFSAIGVWTFIKKAKPAANAIWQRGKQIAALEARVTALEEQLNGAAPSDQCPYCRHRTLVLEGKEEVGEQMPPLMREFWHCTRCHLGDLRYVQM